MSKSVVAFVASNDTHVDMFVPVMRELERRGVVTTIGSLDSLYQQGATARAEALGRAISMIAPDIVVASSFYRRPTIAVWWDVLRCRVPVSEWLVANGPGVVVMGNDRGLIEKLIIHVAHQQGRRVVLVQDGTLVPPPRPGNLPASLRSAAKHGGSIALRSAGLRFLAASQYGEGGADLLCATGPAGAERFRALGVGGDRIVLTGQPRFDILTDPSARRGEKPASVMMFTTPFAHAGFGADLQERQMRVVAGLSRALVPQGIQFQVKPHPRESVAQYRELLGDPSAVVTGRSPDALRECGVAIIGASTVVDEAGILGVPVIVPGDIIHDGRLDHLLPPLDLYPRFERIREGVRLVQRLIDDATERADLVGRQRSAVLARVSVETTKPAYARIADAIYAIGE